MTQELKYKEGYEAALNDVVEWLNENIYQYVFGTQKIMKSMLVKLN